MASVFKRGGKKSRHGRYIASYFDEHGKRRTIGTGTSDYDAARQIASKLETEAALRRRGVINSTQSRIADENQRALADHINEYLEHCEHVGHDPVHVSNKRTQLEKMMKGMGATRLSDLESGKVESYLRGLVKAGKSYRTHNQHRATVVAFMEWCHEGGRVAANNLKIVPALLEAKDRRRVRRALTQDELAKLLGVSEQRKLYYLFAYYTGLRVKAVKAATWGDVDIEGRTIRVNVSNAKGKREDLYLPLHEAVVRELVTAKPPFAREMDRIFKTVPSVRTFHRDCERAKVARYDEQGRQLDRHALRTTLGTHLAKAGVMPQQAMKMMGHSDVRITMKHYTDLRISDTAKAVSVLPTINAKPLEQEQAVLKATGTDNAVASAQHGAQQLCGIQQHPVTSIGNDVSDGQPKTLSITDAILVRKNRANDVVGPGAAGIDLMIGDEGDKMQNSRAVGAVG